MKCHLKTVKCRFYLHSKMNEAISFLVYSLSADILAVERRVVYQAITLFMP